MIMKPHPQTLIKSGADTSLLNVTQGRIANTQYNTCGLTKPEVDLYTASINLSFYAGTYCLMSTSKTYRIHSFIISMTGDINTGYSGAEGAVTMRIDVYRAKILSSATFFYTHSITSHDSDSPTADVFLRSVTTMSDNYLLFSAFFSNQISSLPSQTKIFTKSDLEIDIGKLIGKDILFTSPDQCLVIKRTQVDQDGIDQFSLGHDNIIWSEH
jgi:hypothetical protein